jgi:CHAT domain-containing protein/Tfp pilus assembly protein PilF
MRHCEAAMRATLILLSLTFLPGARLAAQPLPVDKADQSASETDRQKLEAADRALNARIQQLYAQGRPGDALPLAEKMLAIRLRLYPPQRYPDGHPELAMVLTNLGGLLRGRGDYDKAQDCYQRAVAMLRKLYPEKRYPAGHPALARTLGDLGILLKARGDFNQALDYHNQALAMCEKLYPPTDFPDGHPDLAASISNLATLLMVLGDDEKALKNYRRALAMQEKLYAPERYPQGHPLLAHTMGNLGSLLEGRGDYAAAQSIFQRALAMLEKLYPPGRFPRGHSQLAGGLRNLGWLLHNRGDDAAAEPLMRRSVDMWVKLYPPERYPHGHPDVARVLNELGDVLFRQDNDAEALRCYRHSLAMFEKLFPPERYPAGHPHMATGLNNMANLLQAHGDFKSAIECVQRALAMWQKLHPKERFPDGHSNLANTLANLAGLYRHLGDHARALDYQRQALDMQESLYPAGRYPDGHKNLALALTQMGMALAWNGQPAEAEPYYQRAMSMRQRLLETFAAGAAEGEVLLLLATLPGDRDYYLSASRREGADPAQAHAAVWDTRSSVARFLQVRRLALLAARTPATQDLARDLAGTRQELARLLLAPAGLRPDQTKRIRILHARKERLEKDLAGQLPALKALLASTRRTPAELIQKLPQGTAFVDLLRYTHEVAPDPKNPDTKPGQRIPSYVAFVLTPGRPVARIELGDAKPIESAWAAWRQALTAGKKERAEALALAKRIWEPLRQDLPAKTHTVFLAPDAALASVPWSALPGSRPDTVLLEECALAVVPYGQRLLDALLAGPRPDPKQGLLLAVGDVAFGSRPAALENVVTKSLSRAALAEDGRPRWPALPGTARELERVCQLAAPRTTKALRGPQAGSAQLLDGLPQARWAHLATHGFFADARFRSVLRLAEKDYARGRHGEGLGVGARNPLVLSGLVLAGANLLVKDPGNDDSGILTAEAIAGLDLERLDLAVLSACETGLGEVAGGEGVFGLQRAFHLAGARTVVASLWQVDDRATQRLMELFYENLWNKGLPQLESLRRAQLTMLRGMGPAGEKRGLDLDDALPDKRVKGLQRAHPRLWAAWILSGDPGSVPAKRPAASQQ